MVNTLCYFSICAFSDASRHLNVASVRPRLSAGGDFKISIQYLIIISIIYLN